MYYGAIDIFTLPPFPFPLLNRLKRFVYFSYLPNALRYAQTRPNLLPEHNIQINNVCVTQFLALGT